MQTFAGYGNPRAPYWYIGMEEGGDATDQSLGRRLELWQKRGGVALEDLRDYHLGTKLAEFFREPVKLQTTWRQLIRITLLAERRAYDVEAMRRYQVDHLGSGSGQTALLELYPLPAAKLSHWPYATLSDLPILRDRKTYLRALASQRIELIQGMVDQHQPRFVVMYGTSYQDRWERVLGEKFRLDPDSHLLAGHRGRSQVFLMKHPAAIGVTTAYFEAVGRYLAETREATGTQ